MIYRRAVARTPDFLRLLLAVIVFVVSLLAVFPAPTYLAWELSIGVMEWGHIVALIALLPLLPGWRRSTLGRISALLAAAAFVIALSPLARARLADRSLTQSLRTAFGNAPPRTLPGASGRESPIVARDIVLGVESPRIRIDTATYVVRDGKPLGMDLYRPLQSSVSLLPIVVMIHGGSWRGGARGDLPGLNGYLAARGYAVAAISYRFAPQHPHPAASEDVRTAIAFLKSNATVLGLDSSRIALIGRSAGGQLALLAAYTQSDPSIKGAVGLYAPSDQIYGYEHPSNPRVLNSTEVLEGFLAGNPRTVPDAYATSSPVNFVGPSTPPTLLIHGAQDEFVSVQQSERLDHSLASARRQHFFLRLSWATHGCDYNFSGPCGQLSTYAIERFLANVMK